MTILRLHPYVRLSISLIALIVSILLVGQMLGIVPDKSQILLDNRKNLTETLAVQFALAAEKKDFSQIEKTLNVLIKRNPQVLSAAMRKSDGSFYATAGDHESAWQSPPNGSSSPTHIQVPILQGNQLWGSVELSFTPLIGDDLASNLKDSFWGMLLFVAISGFLGYLLLLKRALKELDPSGVIPSRVKSAFDTLTEGILILDEQGQIVLANSAFSNKVGIKLEYLLGKTASSLQWERISVEQLKQDWLYPWNESLKNHKTQTGVRLCMHAQGKNNSIFMVNSAPILGDDNRCRGVLVTFDDVTEIEDNNLKLDTMLKKLELSRSEITRQNDELKRLAEVDPLTGFYNRRALNVYFNEIFNQASEQNTSLICIMLDIDHFKSVNDNYGHQTGDEVIKLVAAITRENLRDTDIVGRYGGEEFCLVLPNLDSEATLKIAERIRTSIMHSTEYHAFGIERVTISLGLSSIKDDVQNPSEMIDLADKALYYAKKNGRNRVVVWKDIAQNEDATDVVADKAPARTEDNAGGKENTAAPEDTGTMITDIHQLHEKIKQLEELNQKQQKLIARHLNFDPATKLPSRLLLQDRLKMAIAHAARSNNCVAILSLSLNSYKRIHSTLGHEAAEQLIIEISHRVSSVLRTTDTVVPDIDMEKFDPVLSRKSDEGFYIMLPELRKDQSITWIINRIHAALDQVATVEGFNIQVESAIGVSLYPIDGVDPDHLLNHADLALYYAEQDTKMCQFYSETMNNQYLNQIKIESGLIRAIEKNELEIFYQPIVNVQYDTINKLEALLRWNHPQKEMLAACNFIEVAERSGLILRIGDWVCREAIQQLAVWRREISQDIQISINVSGVQLKQDDLADRILNYLHENKVPPENLVIEITESAMVQAIENATRTLTRLHDQGVKIALDDFGIGYSPFQYLQKFPVDIVKIDRAFVTDIEVNNCNYSIVSAVANMSKKLGFITVAEGVETEAQFKQLCQLGCDEVQGYLMGYPMPKEQIQRILKRQQLNSNNHTLSIVR
ncbi:MAG: diguanylate cyclase [Nitrosomonas sp.]|nr:MAG: diguanylate cyclase [Nitrosomonas sp.]